MAYTLGEATKATGISKTSLQRAIKSGKVSAIKNALGVWEIDPAELHRVYPPAANRNSSEATTLDQIGTASEIVALRRELQLKDEERQRERAQLEGVIDDLRQRLDAEADERRRLTALLTDQRAKSDVIVTPPPAPPPPRVSPTNSIAKALAPVSERPSMKAEASWWRKMVGGK